ncbi:MAG: hypothetical protein QOH41_3770 [Blastocatellia bacterium]|nr:hypothetical protein [Blastocatellia bacterium]
MNLSLSRTFFKPRSGERSVAHGVSRGDRDTNAPEAAERNPYDNETGIIVNYIKGARFPFFVTPDGAGWSITTVNPRLTPWASELPPLRG